MADGAVATAVDGADPGTFCIQQVSTQQGGTNRDFRAVFKQAGSTFLVSYHIPGFTGPGSYAVSGDAVQLTDQVTARTWNGVSGVIEVTTSDPQNTATGAWMRN